MRQRPRDCVYMRKDDINVVLNCTIILTNLVSVCRCVGHCSMQRGGLLPTPRFRMSNASPVPALPCKPCPTPAPQFPALSPKYVGAWGERSLKQLPTPHPHYKTIKAIAPPTFVTQSPPQRHIRDGRHSEQVGSKHCGIGISRKKAKRFLKIK